MGIQLVLIETTAMIISQTYKSVSRNNTKESYCLSPYDFLEGVPHKISGRTSPEAVRQTSFVTFSDGSECYIENPYNYNGTICSI